VSTEQCVALIFEAINKHENDTELLSSALGTLGHMAQASWNKLKEHITRKDGMHVALSIMNKHPHNTHIQAGGLTVLSLL
jgi:hypothetical protein